jgi:peptidoglycan/LPS O-acetylase OafA/YrhL
VASGRSLDAIPVPLEGLRHEPGLDGLRGLAILLVLGVHLTPFKEPYHGIREALLSIADVGWIGVDLFFVLSSFLITTILIDSKGSPTYFRDFYARRALRIFPLYYAVLVLELVIFRLIFAPHAADTQLALDHSWVFWIYAGNLVPDVFIGEWLSLGHLWSLSMEEQFYIAASVLIALTPRRWLFPALAASTVALFGIQGAMFVTKTTLAAGPFALPPAVLARFDGFLVGSLIAAACRHSISSRRNVFASAPFAAIVAGGFVGELTRRNMLNDARLPDGRLWVKLLAFPSLAFFFGALLILAVGPWRPLRYLFSLPLLRWFGKYSYGIYMFHMLPLPFYLHVFPGPFVKGLPLSGNLASGVYFVLTLPFFLVPAWLSYRYFESPFLRLKKHFAPMSPTVADRTRQPAG